MFEELKELGLTDNEVRIYLALLRHGPLNPYKIAKITGLHRGYIYDSLERMVEKGVVNEIFVENKKHYQPTSPENLVEILRLKIDSVKSIIPDLKKIENSRKENIKIELHRGSNVLKIFLKDLLANFKEGEEALFLGVDETQFEKIEPIYLKKFFNLVKGGKYRERNIIKKGAKKLDEPSITYREIDPKFIGNITHIIYRNKVYILIYGQPIHMITITNDEVAETYKRQFELFWEKASDTD